MREFILLRSIFPYPRLRKCLKSSKKGHRYFCSSRAFSAYLVIVALFPICLDCLHPGIISTPGTAHTLPGSSWFILVSSPGCMAHFLCSWREFCVLVDGSSIGVLSVCYKPSITPGEMVLLCSAVAYNYMTFLLSFLRFSSVCVVCVHWCVLCKNFGQFFGAISVRDCGHRYTPPTKQDPHPPSLPNLYI